jgi:Peptidase propeptide and YPEB domain
MKVHRQGIGIGLLAATLLIAPALMGPTALSSARADCAPGERVDGTSADQAKKKAEGAGFTQVRELRKGCDNVWHAVAMKNGAQVRVAVLPQGQVMQEGD